MSHSSGITIDACLYTSKESDPFLSVTFCNPIGTTKALHRVSVGLTPKEAQELVEKLNNILKGLS